jgi:hypothetical protein
MMNKLAIPLSLAVSATLAGCAGQPVASTPSAQVAPVATAENFTSPRPGPGTVTYLVDPTGPVDGISVQHVTLQMDDGSQQVYSRRGQQIALGSRVR